MVLIEGSERPPWSNEQRSEIAKLRRTARVVGAGLIVLVTIATVGMIVLADEPRTDDMRKLAITAALGGLAGGSLASLIELVEGIGEGFVLTDGTQVLRGSAAADYAEELRDWERRQAERADSAQGPSGAQIDDMPEPSLFGGLSVSGPPVLAVIPLIGAVSGVVAFAGVVGGFLVASSETGTYSVPALMFIAFLGGFFSNKFFRRLAAAADALFGTEDSTRGAGGATRAPHDDRGSSR